MHINEFFSEDGHAILCQETIKTIEEMCSHWF